jgi:hypothetical protein
VNACAHTPARTVTCQCERRRDDVGPREPTEHRVRLVQTAHLTWYAKRLAQVLAHAHAHAHARHLAADDARPVVVDVHALVRRLRRLLAKVHRRRHTSRLLVHDNESAAANARRVWVHNAETQRHADGSVDCVPTLRVDSTCHSTHHTTRRARTRRSSCAPTSEHTGASAATPPCDAVRVGDSNLRTHT